MTATKPPFWQAFVDAEKLRDKRRAEEAEVARAAAAHAPTDRWLRILAERAALKARR